MNDGVIGDRLSRLYEYLLVVRYTSLWCRWLEWPFLDAALLSE